VFDVLRGIRVVDLSQNLAGPSCGQILADLGAEVTKVEPPSGDPARAWGPPFVGEDSAIFLSCNRGKTGITLDLKEAEDRDRLWTRIDRADVLIEAFRSGTIERLGFGRDAVRSRRPALIYVSVSAYGRSGPGADMAGYDPLVQAYTGLIANTGEPEGAPVRVGASVIDIGTGMWGALGVLAALRHRDNTGEGSVVDVSLLDTGLGWMSYHLTGYLATGTPPARSGTSLGLIAPYEGFATSDGQLMIAAANDGLFARLCGALDLGDLLADARFADNPSRTQHRGELQERIENVTRGHSTRDLFALLRKSGVPAAPVHTVPDVVTDAQVEASEMLRAAPHAQRADYWETALPLRFNGQRSPRRDPPPKRPSS